MWMAIEHLKLSFFGKEGNLTDSGPYQEHCYSSEGEIKIYDYI